MKKRKKRALVLTAIVIAIIIVIRYGFIAVFWLVTPGDGALLPKEKLLFEKIKNKTAASEVSREPKYRISAPEDSSTYVVIINRGNCNADSLLLKMSIDSIKAQIDQMNLHPNFYRYKIMYTCKDGKRYEFNYMRHEK